MGFRSFTTGERKRVGAAVPVEDLVKVRNRGGGETTVTVVFDPPEFTRRLGGWPVDEDR